MRTKLLFLIMCLTVHGLGLAAEKAAVFAPDEIRPAGFQVEIDGTNYGNGTKITWPRIDLPHLDVNTGQKGRPRYHDLEVEFGITNTNSFFKEWFARAQNGVAQSGNITLLLVKSIGGTRPVMKLTGCYPTRYELSWDGLYRERLSFAFESIQYLDP